MPVPALLLAIGTATLAVLHCSGMETNSTANRTTCEGHPINKPLDDLLDIQERFTGCRHVNGSIIINLEDEQGLTNENFDFLSQLESIGGVLSFENLALMEQIVIPNLQRIEGKELIPGINASLQVNVIEGDIIFPNLRRITRGDAVFNITNEVCGYLGINWTVILADGSLIDDSNCSMPSCDNCTSGHCWSEGPEHCQSTMSPTSTEGDGNGDDDPFYIEWWNDQRWLVIGVGAGVIVIILLLIFCICCCCCCLCCRRKRNKYTTSMRTVGTTDTIDIGVQKYNSFSLAEMPSVKISNAPVDLPKQHKIVVIEPDHFELAQLLGNGSCGQVYKGYWHTDVDTVSYSVAIKVFGTPSPNYKQIIEEKLHKFLGLEHENVLRLCSVSYSSQLMLAYEYAPISLRQHVMQKKLMLSAMDMITMATQIAKGMAYLASKGISHGNLAARNVMVQQSGIVKVTDYNLYDLIAPSDWLPIRWLAPETLKYRKHNEKSDMWSYGVTVWELVTFGAHPYHGKPTEDMLKALEDGQRLHQPVTVTADLYSILVECWWLDPTMRPSFNKMVKTMATCQSNPSQYVLTMVDSKLDTYLKLPPAATDANPYENLADIDEAGYLLMMSHAPTSPSHSLDPSRSRGALHTASINSDNIVNSQIAMTTFMSGDVRVKDEQYTKVTGTGTMEDEVYVNSQPEQPDSTYDDPSKPSNPTQLSEEPYVQDEVYVNEDLNDGELYELMDKKDSPEDQEAEMYVIPTEMGKGSEQGDNSDSPVNTKTKTGGELYVNPELNNEESIYDDTTNLIDQDDRGYEKMKSGVSINDLNAEYVYAQQDKKASAQDEDEMYEVPDSEGYQNTRNGKPKLSLQENEADEYELLDKASFHESQIYSSVQ